MATDKNIKEENVKFREITESAIMNLNLRAADIENKVNEKEAVFKFNADTAVVYSSDVYEKAQKLYQKIKAANYHVEIDEYIDKKNVSKDEKFIIRIMNHNGAYVEIPYFEYREKMLDFTESERDYIASKIMKMSGTEQGDIKKAAEDISQYIGYLCHFKELQIKVYNNIGWDEYDGKKIFKYDTLYSIPVIPSHDKYFGVNPDGHDVNPLAIDAYRIRGRYENEIYDSLMSDWRGKKEWVFLLVKTMNESVKASLILAAACSGLIRQLLPYTKENNINMNIVGKPAHGKSIISHFALSLFGDPQVLEGSFVDTESAMSLNRVQRPVIPYILDERMLKVEETSDSAKRRAILMDIFREYEGKAKEKLTGKGSEMSGQRTNAPIISSSVDSILDLLMSDQSTKDLGQYRRFIEIKINDKKELFNGDRAFAEKIENVAYTQYGYGVDIIVSYILNELNENEKFVDEKYEDYCNMIGNLLRHKEKDEDLYGLISSTQRFALIITTLDILISAVNDYIEELKGEVIAEGVEVDFIKENLAIDVMNELVDNLVEKMSRVNHEVTDDEMYNNIKGFVEKFKDTGLFLLGEKVWDGKEYFAQLIDDGKEYKLRVIRDRGADWIAVFGKELDVETLKNYIPIVTSGKVKHVEEYKKLGLPAYDIISKELKFNNLSEVLRKRGIKNIDVNEFENTKHIRLDEIIIKIHDLGDAKNMKDSDKEDK